VFKRDPSFTSIVTDSTSTPVKGIKVEIYGPDGKLLATVHIDEDGFYFYYEYKGKAGAFATKLLTYNKQPTITLKANGFAVVNFSI
jgi:hypothetical protein